MIVFASTRAVRRPRRIPSAAALLRILGSVQVTDAPPTGRTSTGTEARPSYGVADHTREGRSPTDGTRQSR